MEKNVTYVAQLELVVLNGLLVYAPALRGTRGVRFVDNVAALMALVRGRSVSAVEELVMCIHAATYGLRIGPY